MHALCLGVKARDEFSLIPVDHHYISPITALASSNDRTIMYLT